MAGTQPLVNPRTTAALTDGIARVFVPPEKPTAAIPWRSPLQQHAGEPAAVASRREPGDTPLITSRLGCLHEAGDAYKLETAAGLCSGLTAKIRRSPFNLFHIHKLST